MSCYLHHVPGRIRIKVPAIKGKPFYAQELEEKLKAISGVYIVSVNSRTGSILAYYDERSTDVRAITDEVSKETGADLSGAFAPDEALSKTGQFVGETIGKAALGIAIGQLLEDSPLALLAAVI